MLENNIKNTITDRLEQVKAFSELFETYQKKTLEVVKTVQADPKTEDDHKENILMFREFGMKVELVRQSIASLTNRLIELYTLAKISGVEIELEDKDLAFLEGAMKNGSLDLFRIEKGELKVMDENYHAMVMNQLKTIEPEQSTAIYQSLLTMKLQ